MMSKENQPIQPVDNSQNLNSLHEPVQPETPQAQAPQQPVHPIPQQPIYQQPVQPIPQQPVYQQPVQPIPQQQPYQQPVQPQASQQPIYQQPVQPIPQQQPYQQPVQPQASQQPIYQQPVQPIPQQQPYQQPTQPQGQQSAGGLNLSVGASVDAEAADRWSDLAVRTAGIVDAVMGGLGVAVAVLAAIISLFASSWIAQTLLPEMDFPYSYSAGTGIILGVILLVILVLSIVSILTLWVGIVTIRNHNNPAKYTFLFAWSIVLFVMSTFRVFWNFSLISFLLFLVHLAFMLGMIWKRRALKH